MSFDWRSFATGFLERQQEISTERREEAKTFEKEQRAAAERNAQTISRRRAIADRVTGYANYLQSNGVSDEQLQAVIATGPEAVTTLTERVQAAVETNNGRPLGSSDVAALINLPEGFTALDMTTQEFIDQTYGLRVPAREEAPAEELTFLQRVSGMGEMARAEERLSRTPFAEGMTILDVNRAAQQADFQSLIPGTFATIASARTGYDIDASTQFATDFDRRLSSIKGSRLWDSAEPTERQSLLEDAMDSIVRQYVGEYGGEFIADQERYLRRIMGDEYVDSLVEEFITPEPEEEEGVETSAPQVGSDGGIETSAPAITETEDAATELPVAPRAEDTDVDDPEAEEDVAPIAPPTDTRVRNPETGEPVTYQQWLDMSRSAREAAGLPVSFLGGQRYFRRFGVGLGIADPETGQRITEQTAETMQAEQPEAYAALSEQGVDDITISLLNSNGADMMQYLKEQGVADQEQAFNALTEWGQQNNVVMPFDKSALVHALMSVINQQ